MGVLAIIVIFMLQLLSGTTATLDTAKRHLDTASLARIVLDRFGSDFSGVILHGGASVIYSQGANNTGDSGIAFLTNSRARGPSGTNAPWTQDTRSALVGYKIRSTEQYLGSSAVSTIPALDRGDARFSYAVGDISGQKVTPDLPGAFGTASSRIPSDLTSTANDERLLNWQIIAPSVLRFHISFVLNDGRIVQTPPQYRNFYASGGMGSTGCVPIAFSRDTSADPAYRFVTGIVVGLTVLDETTRDLAYQFNNQFWIPLAQQLGRPSNDEETPSQIWSASLATMTSRTPGDPDFLFQPVRANIRFYQRFFPVHM